MSAKTLRLLDGVIREIASGYQDVKIASRPELAAVRACPDRDAYEIVLTLPRIYTKVDISVDMVFDGKPDVIVDAIHDGMSNAGPILRGQQLVQWLDANLELRILSPDEPDEQRAERIGMKLCELGERLLQIAKRRGA